MELRLYDDYGWQAEQFGLWRQSAATLDALLWKQIKSCLSFLNSNPQFKPTIWIVDAHRDDGKCFIVRADEKLTAFLELESAIRASSSAFLYDASLVCRACWLCFVLLLLAENEVHSSREKCARLYTAKVQVIKLRMSLASLIRSQSGSSYATFLSRKDREKLRRAILDLVAGRKMRKQKGASLGR